MGLANFIQRLSQRKSEYNHDDPRIAVVALTYYLMDADGIKNQCEYKRLNKILTSQYSINTNDLKHLLETAENAYKDSADIVSFTTIIKQNLDDEERIAFVRSLFDLAYCDGHVYELEDNVIWRIAELIDVKTQDRLQQKHDVANEYRIEPLE